MGITTSNGTLDKGRLYFVEKDPGDASSGAGAGAIFREEDVVRTVRPSHGDYRLVAGQQDVWKDATGKDVFIKHDKYDDTSVMQAHAIREGSKGDIFVKYESGGTFVRGVTYYKEITPDVPTNITDSSVTNIMQTGDWDTGFATVNDGPYINFPDAGGLYNDNLNDGAGAAFFSPNHQVSSAGMFGSLPTRVKAGVPYQTLLFRPSTSGHPAVSDTIPDHLFMDLFWMPIVEPYAISEPFSTAGKINMNYQIVPFTYIERSTALQAAMQAERVLGIPTTVSTTYKNRDDLKNILRNKISAGASSENASGTLSQFMQRFASSDKGYAFKSATEICDLHLVPEGYNVGTMSSFWVTNALTGDNVRERPYANLYQKLTTKSNTFTVHYRVQALQQSNNDPQPTQWREGRDVVTSEYRGSTIIERFISPDTVLPDFADPTTTGTLDSYYKWHIVKRQAVRSLSKSIRRLPPENHLPMLHPPSMKSAAPLLFLAATLLARPLAAETPVQTPPPGGAPLVPPDVLVQNSVKLVGKEYGKMETVAAAGVPFKKALRVTTTTKPVKEYGIQTKLPEIGAIKKGDAILASFYARSTAGGNNDTGAGQIEFGIQVKDWPYPLAKFHANPGPEWKRFYLPMKAAGDAAPGEAHLAFSYGAQVQTIEVGGLELFDYGTKLDLKALPITHFDYAGREPDAAWRRAADERIEKLRKADLIVTVKGADGRPLPAATVNVRMKRHAFEWGATLNNRAFEGTPFAANILKYHKEFFNMGVGGRLVGLVQPGNPQAKRGRRQDFRLPR